MSVLVRRFGWLLVPLAIAAAVAGVSVADSAGRSPGPKESKAEKLTREPATQGGRGSPVLDHRSEARQYAAHRSADLPLPDNGNFNGVQWEQAEGPVSVAEVESVLEYNAACQWLRAWRDGREVEIAHRVLAMVPDWPALRATESAQVLRAAAAEARGRPGPVLEGILLDCDASQSRQAAFARARGLTPSG